MFTLSFRNAKSPAISFSELGVVGSFLCNGFGPNGVIAEPLLNLKGSLGCICGVSVSAWPSHCTTDCRAMVRTYLRRRNQFDNILLMNLDST
jgi:hypothetical protein